MYTYPITKEGAEAYRLTLIKEIFQQLKFIKNGINPLPDKMKNEIMEKPNLLNRKKVWYADIFDVLYDTELRSLKIVNENLAITVNTVAKGRLESAQ